MEVTLGGVAGLIAAIGLLILVGFVALPLFKLGKVMDELKGAVKELTDASVPILNEIEGTVVSTNSEVVKLGVVTDDVATVSTHVTSVTGDVARLTTLVTQTVAVPFVKVSAFAYATRRAFAGLRKKSA